MMTHTSQEEPIHLTECLRGIAVAKVSPPAAQPAINLGHHGRQWHQAPSWSSQLPQNVLDVGESLLRGKHIQVPMPATTKVGIVPQRETQEVQAGPRLIELHHLG